MPVAIPKTALTAMSGAEPDWHITEAIPARAKTAAKIDANEARRCPSQKSKTLFGLAIRYCRYSSLAQFCDTQGGESPTSVTHPDFPSALIRPLPIIPARSVDPTVIQENHTETTTDCVLPARIV